MGHPMFVNSKRKIPRLATKNVAPSELTFIYNARHCTA